MIHCCVFDIDGTILDSMPVWKNLGTDYLQSIGVAAKEHLNEVLFTMTSEQSAHYLKEQYHLHESEAEIKNGFLHLIAYDYQNLIQTKPGVSAFLYRIKQNRIPMIAATSSDALFIKAALDRLNIADCFQEILTTSELLTDKKNSYIYQTAASHMHEEPCNTAVFEDTYDALITAKKAGFYTIAIEDDSSFFNQKEIRQIADIYLEDFSNPEIVFRQMRINAD